MMAWEDGYTYEMYEEEEERIKRLKRRKEREEEYVENNIDGGMEQWQAYMN